MANLSRRNMIAGGAMLAASAIAYARQPVYTVARQPKGAIDRSLPRFIGPWRFESTSGLVLPPPDSLTDRLYDEISTRVYTADGLPAVMLLIAYSNTQDGMLQVHRPETCYPVGGYELTNPRVIELPLALGRPVACRFFSASGASNTEQVLYWTRIGDEIPGRWFDQRLAVVRANLRRKVPDGILVRFSIVDEDAEASIAIMNRFATELLATVRPAARKLLIGA